VPELPVVQWMPAGVEVTVPLPVTVAESWNCWTNVATIDTSAVNAGMVQLPIPEHAAPAHPAKTQPPAGSALRIVRVPSRKVAEQLPAAQVSPAGTEWSAPCPIVAAVTVWSGASLGAAGLWELEQAANESSAAQARAAADDPAELSEERILAASPRAALELGQLPARQIAVLLTLHKRAPRPSRAAESGYLIRLAEMHPVDEQARAWTARCLPYRSSNSAFQ
jgi:hypothetical protein